MRDADKPIGQRREDGHVFGVPFAWFNTPRADYTASAATMREHEGWRDRIGQPHGRSGDKLARKAMQGKIGLRHGRGPFAAMHLTAR